MVGLYTLVSKERKPDKIKNGVYYTLILTT